MTRAMLSATLAFSFAVPANAAVDRACKRYNRAEEAVEKCVLSIPVRFVHDYDDPADPIRVRQQTCGHLDPSLAKARAIFFQKHRDMIVSRFPYFDAGNMKPIDWSVLRSEYSYFCEVK